MALIFADFERRRSSGGSYTLACCDGLAMDLLASVARELKFEIDLYLVVDGYYGSRNVSESGFIFIEFILFCLVYFTANLKFTSGRKYRSRESEIELAGAESRTLLLVKQ